MRRIPLMKSRIALIVLVSVFAAGCAAQTKIQPAKVGQKYAGVQGPRF